MVSDDGYARPRDPYLFETTRTKHSRHHLTSNFNIFDARAVPITKPNPSAPISMRRTVYMEIISQCALMKPAAATCLLHLETIELSIHPCLPFISCSMNLFLLCQCLRLRPYLHVRVQMIV